uniref:Guanylate cyclase n=1 Tax=Cyclopterus lumpus TaxID=8103 RepID=A0A8C2WXB7_CYCLU
MLSRWPCPPGTCPSLLLLFLLVQSAASSPSADNTTAALQEVTLAAILPLTNTDYAWAWPRVAPALFQAVRQVNSDHRLLPGLKLRLIHRSSENHAGFCSDSMAPLVAVDLKLSHDPWAFVGPGCDYSSSPVARFTTHWEVPMVTAGARAIGFEHYAAVTNTGPTHQKLGELGVRIQEAFDWRRHAMLIFSDNKDANDDRPCFFSVEGIYTLLGKRNVTIRYLPIQADAVNYREVVQQIQDNGRGLSFVFLLRSFLHFHSATVCNIYIYICICMYTVYIYVCICVCVYMYIMCTQPDISLCQYNLIAAGFHDGVMMYSQALNETLSEQRPGPGLGPGEVRRPKGDLVTRRMWNRTFSGSCAIVTCYCVCVCVCVCVCACVCACSCPCAQVVCVYNSSMKQLIMQGGRSFQWPGGSPPPDVPECGFKNDKPACLALSCLLNRKLTLESELAAQLWRVSWDDVELINLHSQKGSNCGSLITMEGNFLIYTKTGYYKGNLAAIKYINKKRIELTRKVLFELKHMRDVQNEHLTRFIGACIDPPNMCIITEYCPRGSLQDLMESDITLDWMFRYSLINDIVKGMLFLHNSVIVSHGNLKSSNCVVDSRFVLKITDYGLESLRTANCPEDTHAYYTRKLWTAPELLRTECRPPCGTQRGDIYSFSIILQEVALLKGVFYLDSLTLTPKEIVQAVLHGGPSPLRPSLCLHSHREELGVLMQRCWSQDPQERPDFNGVKILLRKGHGSNILDNLLSRMEQYANNLEELVEERTHAYHEEKHKYMYQILPHSVAEQLKRGETVQAEAFDSVTIYLSDIIGFTALSAESTPLQVVTLLNDLYTCFDAIIDNFDVYKVETIGDAYMVVSGLPVRNGKLHGREVARMALALLDAVKSFRMQHRANQQLRLRIGIHSGPVCAGVVGLKMPRYCLFGDTVNTASRMESNGEALRIHVSEATREVLQEFNCFQLQLRGEIQMKGKGSMRTLCQGHCLNIDIYNIL